MTEEKQRAAMAKLEGWINQGEAKGVPALNHKWLRPGTKNEFGPIPTYASLDDLHRLEEKLNADQVVIYNDLLFKSVNDHRRQMPYSLGGWLWHATASQRREALIKALELWVEE